MVMSSERRAMSVLRAPLNVCRSPDRQRAARGYEVAQQVEERLLPYFIEVMLLPILLADCSRSDDAPLRVRGVRMMAMSSCPRSVRFEVRRRRDYAAARARARKRARKRPSVCPCSTYASDAQRQCRAM